MATQVIRFIGPTGQTVTLDVFSLDSDTAEQSGLTCTEATNRKGLFTTASFTDTLSGRFLVIRKVAGDAVGNDFVIMQNTNGTYDSDAIIGTSAVATSIASVESKVDNIIADTPMAVVTAMDSSSVELADAVTQATTAATQATAAAIDAKRTRQFDSNRRTVEVLGDTQWRYTVYEDDATTVAYRVDFNPLTGAKAVVA